ncbi:MAG: Chaperone protein DnaK [Chroococcidiopsis sp. SAG 2025]|uniref:Hsp70 family protein n=1 Tax=Chroococcidiopsis sp. SAG 2025 TaxID=171389 RepID=UPI002937169A|nr:Hsp70 family protein [Chroococcidiopsis sp. SAG 2025]MDV2998276.1 Chaperone protein DnaK [Chroococcidiopsis sp. SAG 2025]
MVEFIGIDLGTTYSVVSYINSYGQPEVIPNDIGQRITPSVVDLTSNPPLVGEEAKDKQALGDEGVYAFFKRDMGNSHALYIEKGKQYTPIDLSAIVLSHLKRCAEEHLGQTVTDAVITVPAYFNNMQREATIKAGKQAGLNVLRIINEPTSAALAYGIRPTEKNSKILVYDLGGGTFDVSIVEVTPSELRVITTAGDHMLGGKDWDDRILLYLSEKFEEEFGVELADEDFNDLMVLAEKTKVSLSTKQSVKVPVKGNNYRGNYEINRSLFAELTADLLERTQALIDLVLEEANLSWQEIDGVVLVGGSTRMPMVREYVEQMSGKPPIMGVNPDEAVALGAAIQAAMDLETQDRTTQPLFLLGGRKKSTDVISHSLGMIAVNEDNNKYINSIIIQKNQPIPCQQTRPYQLRLRRDGENKLEVFMTQAETLDPMGCAYLGMYVFTEIPPIQAKSAVIDITYSYNLNGVVEVSAVERSTQKPLKLTIEPLPSDVPDDRFLKSPQENIVREHLNIYLVFDLSLSMVSNPATVNHIMFNSKTLSELKKSLRRPIKSPESPIQQATNAARNFVSQCDLTTSSIGIIEFAERVRTTVKANQNINQINRGIDGLVPSLQNLINGNGTSANPFKDLLHNFKNTKGLRYGLVLTDGEWQDPQAAIRTAKQCHKLGIEIIAIGFGEANRDFLRQISSREELSFFTSLNELTETFNTIAQELIESEGQIDPYHMRERKNSLKLW